MRKRVRSFLIIPLVLVLIMGIPFANSQSVPDWVKNTAGWWARDAISETEFVNAIQFLVNEGIISIKNSISSEQKVQKLFDESIYIIPETESYAFFLKRTVNIPIS